MSLHLAFISYINSSFLSIFSGERSVSLIYVASSIVSVVALFLVPKILQKKGIYKFLLLASGLNAVTLLLLSLGKNSLIIIPTFIFYFTLNSLIVFSLDELLEMFSKNSSTGHVRGLYLTILNLAWVLSQAISGRMSTSGYFPVYYFIAFLIMTIFFFIAFTCLKDLNDPKYDKTLGWQSFRNFFANKNLARAYKINFLLQFFYVWMVIYTPIYLYAHLGFSWSEISMIFTVMLLPFVLIQFPLGIYSDKIGEKKMLILGFLIASIATLSLYYIKAHEVWIWALALFCTRVGAAIIEVMTDVYFFKHIEKENDEFIAVYRNTAGVSYIFAPIMAFIAFALTPSYNSIFLILGVIMMYGIYLSGTIKDRDI